MEASDLRNDSAPLRPFLKWAGGKRQLLPEISRNLPIDFRELRYFEPFVGAGALFLDKLPAKATINDFNTQLMIAYEVIRNNIDDLINELRLHEANNCKEYFYKIRSLDRDKILFSKLSNVEKSARLIYLNKTCYNGLYRVNSKDMFNVPYGRYARPAICDEPALRSIHRYLADEGNDILMLNGDFEEAVAQVGAGCFVYFDPPYHSFLKSAFTSYQSGGFGESEQMRLRDVFARLPGVGAKCLLSNSDTPFIRRIYDDPRFEILPVTATRTINSNHKGRGPADEVLVKNWK